MDKYGFDDYDEVDDDDDYGYDEVDESDDSEDEAEYVLSVDEARTYGVMVEDESE